MGNKDSDSKEERDSDEEVFCTPQCESKTGKHYKNGRKGEIEG